MKSYILLILLALISFQLRANFELPGNGTITYPSGIKKEFNFGFKWDKHNKLFTIAGKEYAMDQLPSSYSLSLTLTGDEQTVYVQEFASGFISEFEWQIGPHKIKLVKTRFEDPVKGDYVLWVDKSSYFLVNKNPSIKLVFNQEGIHYILPSGITTDSGKWR